MTSSFKKLRGLLFDIDGTLSNTDEIHFAIMQQVLEPFGHKVDQTFYQAKITGRHNPVLFRELLPSHYTDQQILDFGDNKESIFRNSISSGSHSMVAAEGLVDFLSSLKSFNESNPQSAVKCHCVTNACRANAEFMVTHLKIDHHFETLVIGDECEHGKPHPAPYLEGMKRAGIKPDETVVFEDSPAGIRSAVAAGVKVIVGITSTQTEEALSKAGATYIVDNFSTLTLEKLDELLQKE
eukprot:TRINITY_DN8346_c0_g1_i1.p1 TRINITY_DN8346_c0_g1~~TRINITY_DN8346_c0_g1_i1.p1  ORF type:complete len:239 (-),score=79.21 TRINITY_DN8346_c0_g1_i1:21-737(-)